MYHLYELILSNPMSYVAMWLCEVKVFVNNEHLTFTPMVQHSSIVSHLPGNQWVDQSYAEFHQQRRWSAYVYYCFPFKTNFMSRYFVWQTRFKMCHQLYLGTYLCVYSHEIYVSKKKILNNFVHEHTITLLHNYVTTTWLWMSDYTVTQYDTSWKACNRVHHWRFTDSTRVSKVRDASGLGANKKVCNITSHAHTCTSSHQLAKFVNTVESNTQ